MQNALRGALLGHIVDDGEARLSSFKDEIVRGDIDFDDAAVFFEMTPHASVAGVALVQSDSFQQGGNVFGRAIVDNCH